MNKYIYAEGAIHNDNHKELTINVSGKTDVAALMKSFMADNVEDVEEVKEEDVPTASENVTATGEIINYVMKLHPIYVSETWKEHYRSLWETIIKLPEVKAVIYNRGRQKNTTFNRNLVGNILCQMNDNHKKVLNIDNATKLALVLEGNEGASIRAQLGAMPSSEIENSVARAINNFLR